jgi:hypothetical protein
MKKNKVVFSVIVSLASAAAITSVVLLICKKLFDKKYFTVN